MRVTVRVDAGPLIGGGHAMRCLTLADALAEHGADVTFVAAAMPDAIAERIAASGHTLIRIPASPELDREGEHWHERLLSDEAQRADVEATGTAGPADWLIVDHYLLDARWHSASRRFADRLLVIDDLANRECDCDFLLDQTLGREPRDYDGLLPSAARRLIGAQYALLRPEFAQERIAALQRRRAGGKPRRLLISLGTTDPGEVTGIILEQVLEAAPACSIDVVLGPQAASADRVQRLARGNPRVSVHVASTRMAELMRDADIAIGAAGVTSWERCCLGVSSVVLVLAKNQRLGATALSQAGAAVIADRAEDIGEMLRSLVEDALELSRMSAAAFAITDGQGTDRAVRALFRETEETGIAISLRAATADDAELLWLWRNDPLTRFQSRNSAPIAWSDHARWFTGSLSSSATRVLIAERNGIPAGVVRFDQHGADCEVSITVAPGLRGSGIGRHMLRAACEQTTNLFAVVRDDNQASRRLFESCGFTAACGDGAGFRRYVLERPEFQRNRA